MTNSEPQPRNTDDEPFVITVLSDAVRITGNGADATVTAKHPSIAAARGAKALRALGRCVEIRKEQP